MSSSQLDIPEESQPESSQYRTLSQSGTASPSLPEIPAPELDLSLSLDSILNSTSGNPNPEAEKVQKRASNVLKLAQENEKLKAELQAMTDRLEAAERRRKELASKHSGESKEA
ncbi:hypothetical protein PLICRDRAFT_176172 [Plicaturopsis crispa FD-325 SS-3]|nr:hypothetical protein PLICRDRAFT_176172 [Plicaturopsis crispa FD-325 SS-3]